MNNYQLLLHKIDSFTRKYYTNKLIRGSIWFFTIVIAYFIVINVLEYYLYLPSFIRKFFFFSFIGICLTLLWFNVVTPILKIYRMGKLISHADAARIISAHFKEVKDKLLNVLQLEELRHSTETSTLIEASINQKIEELRPLPFAQAVNYAENRKYLKYLAIPILLAGILLVANARIFTEGSERIIRSDQQFDRKAAFRFEIENEKLSCLQGNSFTLHMHTEGEVSPAEVNVVVGDAAFKMKKDKTGSFSYDFVNLQKNVRFSFTAAGIESIIYELTVIPRPSISGFSVYLDYPAYTGLEDERLQNVGDLTIPCGTTVRWDISSRHAVSLGFHINDSLVQTLDANSGQISFSRRFLNNSQYALYISGKSVPNADSLNYLINVIPDEHPQIFVKEIKDSSQPFFLFYTGEISDDYGLEKLVFNYTILQNDSSGNPIEKSNRIPIAFNKNSKISQYLYDVNLRELNLGAGDQLRYYFEVFDNDAVHGSKSSRTGLMEFAVPGLEEFEERTEQNNEEIKSELKSLIKESSDIKEDMEKLREELLQKKELGWQEKKKIADLISRQKQMEQQINAIQNKNEMNNQQQQDYKELSPEIAQKQKDLEKLFNEVLDPETKALIEKMEKMLDEMKKEDALKNMEEMKLNNEDLEKELDRMLDLFKELQAEQKMKETATKLDELAKKQEDLAKETEAGKTNPEELKQKQEDINKELEEIKKDMEEIDQLNKENGKEEKMEGLQQDLQQTREKTKEASKQIEQQENSKAAEQQKSAANDMKEMSEKMSQMQQEGEQQQMEEDYKSLMQLLENLLTLSYEQEQLMNELKQSSVTSPIFIELTKRQYKLKDDSKMIEDSLYALAGRVEQIQKFVTDEINQVNRNLNYALDHLEDRKLGEALSREQFVMTGYNNLALMLSEIQQQMQMAMSQAKSQQKKKQEGDPNSSCKNPGQGKPKMSSLSKMQGQLNEQIKELGEMKKSGQLNSKQEAQKFSELAQKQAAVRQALQEIDKSDNKMDEKGQKSLGDLQKLADKMNETETQLLNKELTEQMLLRQKDITVRLMEAEKAEKEQDQKEERKSETAADIKHEVPANIEEYLKKRESEIELYRKIPPSLKPFYKGLVEKYLQNIPQ